MPVRSEDKTEQKIHIQISIESLSKIFTNYSACALELFRTWGCLSFAIAVSEI